MSSILKSLKKLEDRQAAIGEGWQPQKGPDGGLALASPAAGTGRFRAWGWAVGLLCLVTAAAGLVGRWPLPEKPGAPAAQARSADPAPPPAAVQPTRPAAAVPVAPGSVPGGAEPADLPRSKPAAASPVPEPVASAAPRPVREAPPAAPRVHAPPAAEADPPVSARPVARPAAESAGEDLMELPPSLLDLQAVAWAEAPEERIAVINGQVVREGGSVAGFGVRRIDEFRVVLDKEGEKWQLVFKGR